jgi:Acyl-CoA carboxylase epsilon subunit
VTEPAFLQILRGQPTPEQLAALVAVLAAAGAEEPARPAPDKLSGWTDRSRYVRGTLQHDYLNKGPGGWRAAAFPR